MGGRLTPEGRVKNRVKDILARYRPWVTGRWIVQNGMGQPCLDYHGCANGFHFTIETKRAGLKPTQRQQLTLYEFAAAGSKNFIIAGLDEIALAELDEWLFTVVSRGPIEAMATVFARKHDRR